MSTLLARAFLPLRANPSLPTERAIAGSFITGGNGNETSFSRAPLSSRLPPSSPHRVTIAAATGAARRARSSAPPVDSAEEDDLPGAQRSYRRTGKEVEQSDDELEDEVLEDDVLSEGQSRRVEGLDKESLKGLSTELQEALIVEDLLYVLMVSGDGLSRRMPRSKADLTYLTRLAGH